MDSKLTRGEVLRRLWLLDFMDALKREAAKGWTPKPRKPSPKN
jgi:hypothetical protein